MSMMHYEAMLKDLAYHRNRLHAIIKGRIPRELPTLDYHAMMNEVNSIANSMRKVATRANATGHINTEEYEKNLQALLDAILRNTGGGAVGEGMGQ